MSTIKKILLLIFGIFIVGLDVVLYHWLHSFETEKIPYLKTYDEPLGFDKDGKVWIDSWNSGVSQLQVYKDGQLVQIYTENDTLAVGINIQDFIVDTNGQVWITRKTDTSNTNLIAMYDGKQWQYPVPEEISLMKDYELEAVAVDDIGRLWIGVPNYGLYIIDGNKWENYTTENSDLINNTVWDITFDAQGQAWIATYPMYKAKNGGVNVFDGKNWKTYTPENSPLLSNYVNTIKFDSQNRAWIGTNSGINIFDGRNWTNYHLSTKGINRKVESLLFDSQERAWINNTRILDGDKWLYYFDPYHLDIKRTIVDNEGNIWSHSFNNGTRIIRHNAAQPISSYNTGLTIYILSRTLFYFTFLLVILWITIALNAWGSIGMGLLGFPVYLVIYKDAIKMLMDNFENFVSNENFLNPLLNPTIYATFFGVAGGTLEFIQQKNGIPKTRRWGLIGFLTGLVLSSCCIYLPGLFAQ